MRGNDAFEFFFKWHCHVERSELSYSCGGDRSGNDQRFFASLRMTLRNGLYGVGEAKTRKIDEYLARVSPAKRALLQKLRQTIREVAPKVKSALAMEFLRSA